MGGLGLGEGLSSTEKCSLWGLDTFLLAGKFSFSSYWKDAVKSIFLPCGLDFHYFFKVVFVQSLSGVRLFATPWTATCQASLSFTVSWSLLKLMSIELVIDIKLNEISQTQKDK